MIYDAAVIGAGPGGLVSALYLRRFLRETALISNGEPRASWIPRTHNLLGYRGGISGRELLQRLQAQIDECGIDRVHGEAKITVKQKIFTIETDKEVVRSKKVIIATGMTDTQPPLPNLKPLRRDGLLRYCPVCDAYEYRSKKLLVLAQDEHGIKAARFLSRFASAVEVLWPPSQKLPGVSVLQGSVADIQSLRGKANVHWTDKQGREHTRTFDAVYVALGSIVQDSAFRHLRKIQRTENGFLLVNSHQETAIKGLYAVGDCVEGLAQIAVAAGQAAVAATAIHNQLLSAGQE
jgi:thioredoxin reductase (NADPH)